MFKRKNRKRISWFLIKNLFMLIFAVVSIPDSKVSLETQFSNISSECLVCSFHIYTVMMNCNCTCKDKCKKFYCLTENQEKTSSNVLEKNTGAFISRIKGSKTDSSFSMPNALGINLSTGLLVKEEKKLKK
ncbi:hypothetical protein EDEG_01488 [Edhazardia aedis USNM 41457]|uniref:Uncharacterized protein n=1 Tax=Edhazardia aedis (strain USNM 41457) TaxID=1003232 RepID=J9D9N7_EDHAE|nr:hypothetical protein EDEG_01488 [Edhazardia aedis USNM 41457]|eukprot:EJW04219.1 hypothetical protein EDEG_01488 [Edhazardia aedis USNM 41457]